MNNINAVNTQPVLNVADMSDWKGQVRSQAMPQNAAQAAPASDVAANAQAAVPASAAEPSYSASVAGKIDFMA